MTDRPSKRDFSGPEWYERTGRMAWLFIGIIGAGAIFVIAVQWLSSIVIPLVLAAFLAAVFAPVVDWLQARRTPRSLGAGIVVIGILAVFVGALTLVGVGIVNNADELSDQLDRAQTQLTDLSKRWNLGELLERLRSSVSSSNLGSGIGQQVGSAVSSTVAFASGTVLAIVLLYYLLRDGRSMMDAFLRQWRPSSVGTINRIVHSSVGSVRAYMRGRTILAVVQGVAVGGILWIMGVPLPLAVGVVTFITAYIPYLGAVIGGGFAVLMGLAGGGLSDAIWALLVVLFVNLVLENALEPFLTGSSLNLHPVVVLLVTVIGGLIAGMVGLVLASPITAITRNLYGELKDSGFFGGSDPPATDPPDAQ